MQKFDLFCELRYMGPQYDRVYDALGRKATRDDTHHQMEWANGRTRYYYTHLKVPGP